MGSDPSGYITMMEVMVTNSIVGILAGATTGWISTGTKEGAFWGGLTGLAAGLLSGYLSYIAAYLYVGGATTTSAIALARVLT